MYLCIRGINFGSFYDSLLDCWNVPTMWYILFLILFTYFWHNLESMTRFVWYCLILMNEWLLFNANSVICQLYHGETRLIFNEMMTFLLDSLWLGPIGVRFQFITNITKIKMVFYASQLKRCGNENHIP